ncbi:MAG: ribosomal protein S18-alanine N-acetyltransferase [Pseudomonadota bacterium]
MTERVAAAHHIRPGRVSDLAALFAVDAEAARLGEQRLRAACDGEHDELLVCEREGKISGFILLSLVLNEGSIFSIAVCSTERRWGCGRRLLQAGTDALRRRGASRALLEVRRSNGAAIALYESAGFTIDGVRRGYYRSGAEREDALLMSRALD